MQKLFPALLLLLTSAGATLATAHAAAVDPYIQCYDRRGGAEAGFPAPYPIRVQSVGTDHVSYLEYDTKVEDAKINSGADQVTVSYKRTEYGTPILYSFEFDLSHCHDHTGSAVLTWAVIDANGSPSPHDRTLIHYGCTCWMN